MEENNRAENITRHDLEEQTQVLLSALDGRFDKMEKRLNDTMDVRFNAVGIRMDGIESKLDEVESKLDKKIDELQTSIDGFVKKESDFEQEHTIEREEMKQVKRALKDKLGVAIEAA